MIPDPLRPQPKPTASNRRESAILTAVILFQIACAAVLFRDVLGETGPLGWADLTDPQLVPELLATLGLFGGIAMMSLQLARLLRRQAHMERTVSIAQGALAEVVEAYFADWGLTPSEQDVASFTIKGYSIAEIAELRASAEATVKTHLNAIYRKAGVAGRGQLVSLLVEDLMGGPVAEHAARAQMADRAG